MNSKITRAILAGIIGTVIMSIVMFLVPLIGLPERSPANMLAGMTGTPVVVGWILVTRFLLTTGFITTVVTELVRSPIRKKTRGKVEPKQFYMSWVT